MSVLKDLTVDWVSFVDRAAVRDPSNPTEPQRFLVMKRDGTKGSPMPTPTTEDLQAQVETLTTEKADLATEKADLQKQLDEAVAKAAKKPASDEDEKDGVEQEARKEEVEKNDFPPEIRAALEKADREREALQKRAEHAEEIAKAERNERITRDFIAKAEEFQALPIEAPVFGPVLKSVSEKLTKEEAEELNRVLKAADEQIAKGDLFAEMGKSGSPPKPVDAFAEAQRKAEELRKADPSLTAEKALSQAMADPDLQSRYAAEVRS